VKIVRKDAQSRRTEIGAELQQLLGPFDRPREFGGVGRIVALAAGDTDQLDRTVGKTLRGLGARGLAAGEFQSVRVLHVGPDLDPEQPEPRQDLDQFRNCPFAADLVGGQAHPHPVLRLVRPRRRRRQGRGQCRPAALHELASSHRHPPLKPCPELQSLFDTRAQDSGWPRRRSRR